MERDPLYEVITASEADELFGKASGTTRVYINQGKIRARHSGKVWLVLREDCRKLYRPETLKQGELNYGTVKEYEGDYVNVNEGLSDYVIVDKQKNGYVNVKEYSNDYVNGKVMTVLSGRRKTVHVVDQQGVPLCYKGNQHGTLVVGSRAERDVSEVNCAHCRRKAGITES
jgi:hypothetical protein